MKINNQIKEIEKEIKYYEDFSKKKDIHAFPTYLQKLIELKIELELLKQFQKEIKEIQEELKEEHINLKKQLLVDFLHLDNKSIERFIIARFKSSKEKQDKIIKKRFGEMK